MTKWLWRVAALVALLAFWSGLLVLTGLPRWSLAVPGGLVALAAVAASLPLLRRLGAFFARGSIAAGVTLARAGAAMSGSTARGLRRTVRAALALARRSAARARVELPRAARATASGARGAVGSSARAATRTAGRARAAGERRERAAAAADRARRRRHSAQLGLAASRLLRLGRPDEAAARCEHALLVLRTVGDSRTEAATLETLALAHVSRGDEEQALDCYRRALAILRELGDAAEEALVVSAVAALTEWRETADEPVARWRRGLEAAARPKRQRKAAPRKRPTG